MGNVLSKPSDASDPRFRLPRSPECPNDAPARTCGDCAWGFYSHSHEGPGMGESISELSLEPVTVGHDQLGYRARCGAVRVFRDQEGRVGAVRRIGLELRFFPGIEGNWAYERYRSRHVAEIGT